MTVKTLVSNFTEIVTRKYYRLDGRAGRAEFWQWVLACLLIFWTLGLVGQCFHHPYLPPFLFFVAAFLPGLGVGTRRLHDVGRSGWWQLLGFTGIGFFIFFIMCIPKGDAGENKYGAPDDDTEK